MTLKAHANQQSTVLFFHRKREGAGLGPIAVPRLRRDFRHSGRLLADAILVPGGGDVNLNLKAVSSDAYGEAREGCSIRPAANSFVAGGAFISEDGRWGEVRPTAAALDDDDELDEDDEEDLEDEDDLDLDDEGEDEDEDDDDLDEDEDEDDLDDDDLDDEDDEEEEE